MKFHVTIHDGDTHTEYHNIVDADDKQQALKIACAKVTRDIVELEGIDPEDTRKVFQVQSSLRMHPPLAVAHVA